MKTRRFLHYAVSVLLIWGLLIPSTVTAKTKWRSVKPEGTPHFIRYGSKSIRYYRITEKESVRLVVYGPTTVRVSTRLGMKADETENVYYTVQVEKKGKVIKKHITSTSVSNSKFDSPTVFPGKKRTFTFKVPKGKQTYEFKLVNSGDRETYIRFHKTAKKKKKKKVLIQPVKYKEVLNTVVSEKLSKYYLADKKTPVELEIIGPTTVTGYSRLNFTTSMKGKVQYNFEVFEDNKLFKEISEAAKKSDFYYKNKSKVVPSIANKLEFKVPSGKHIYKFIVKNGAPGGISFRFLIPESDLKNKE